MQLFLYDPKDKVKRGAKKVASREKLLMSCFRKKFDETAEQGSSNQDRNTEMAIATNAFTERSNGPPRNGIQRVPLERDRDWDCSISTQSAT